MKLLNFNSFDTFGYLEEISKEINIVIISKNKKYAREYFEIACADFNAFKKLYKNSPSLGVYHLEQFHEKLINSFLLLSGRAEPKELENHNKAVKKINALVKTKLFSKYINIYEEKENRNLNSNIKYIINENAISVNPTEKEIFILLLFLNKIKDKCVDDVFIAKFVKKNTKGQKVIFIQKLLAKFNISAKKKEVKFFFTNKLIKDILFFNYLNFTIILLYLLFLPHCNRTRYIRGEINYFSYRAMDLTKKLDKNKKIFVPITLDKNIYFYLKKRDIKISTYINQMLKVALNKGSSENDDFYDPNLSTLVRLRSRFRLPPEA